jgi:hypothetical protein
LILFFFLACWRFLFLHLPRTWCVQWRSTRASRASRRHHGASPRRRCQLDDEGIAKR